MVVGRNTIAHLVKLADLLGCSLDYLFGRDVPESGTGTAEPKWIAGRPTKPGVYLTKFHPLDDDLVLTDIQTVYADGSFSLGDVDVVAWYPIPPEV